MACCHNCHRYVETHANLARLAGVIQDDRSHAADLPD